MTDNTTATDPQAARAMEDSLRETQWVASIMRTLSNEAGVRGSVIEKTHGFLKEEMKPTVFQLAEHGTGVLADVVVSKDGISALPGGLFEASRTRPRFRKGTAHLYDIDSFINHTNRFADDDSVIFANPDLDNPSLTAVLNYHHSGAESDPRFGDHRGKYAFPLSKEWIEWKAMNDKTMTMRDFALFLEDNIINVVPRSLITPTPEQKKFIDALGGIDRLADPATLMDLAHNFQVFENSVAKQAVKLSSGEAQIEFESTHNDAAGKPINIPTMFAIAVPVFKNDQNWLILARLRYRKEGPQIRFYYELWRDDLTFEAAFEENLVKVAEETKLPIMRGQPE